MPSAKAAPRTIGSVPRDNDSKRALFKKLLGRSVGHSRAWISEAAPILRSLPPRRWQLADELGTTMWVEVRAMGRAMILASADWSRGRREQRAGRLRARPLRPERRRDRPLHRAPRRQRRVARAA